MNIPAELKYTKEHEWIRVEGNKAYVGITDYAQHELGEVVFVELPAVDSEVSPGQAFAVVESVKAVSDIYAPLSGKVVEVNQELEDAPELVNQDAYQAWIAVIELSAPEQLADLLDAQGYLELINVD